MKEFTMTNKKTFRIIAVDFDGTLVTNMYPDIGNPITKTIERVKKEQRQGSKIILWTCRFGEALDNAVAFCKEVGIHLDAVNENVPEIIDAFGGDSRKIFANEYWDDRAITFSEHDSEPSSIIMWVEKEVELACAAEKENTDEWGYGCAIFNSALRAMKSLASDGHSGMSIELTKHVLNRLIEGKPLTPITERDTWTEVGFDNHIHAYQCDRMSSLFKCVRSDGTVNYTDVNRYYCVEADDAVTYNAGSIHDILDEMWPITLPYMPGDRIKVICESLLTDEKNDDWDTIAVRYAVIGEETMPIERYFKDTSDGVVEIDYAEFWKRVMKASERLGEEVKGEMPNE